MQIKNLNINNVLINELTDEEKEIKRNLYLRELSLGKIQGPPVGYSYIDKPWLKFYDEDAIVTKIKYKKIYDHLYECNKNHLDDIALLYYGRKISFREMFENIDQVAKSLTAMGVKEDDIVTITIPSMPETIYLFYALNRIGAIVNSIDPRTNEKRLRTFINGTNSKLLFTVDRYSQVLSRAINDTNIEKGVIISPKDSLPIKMKMMYNIATKAKELKDKSIAKTKDSRFISWNEFMHLGKDIKNVEESSYKPNKAVGIVYTSGTTGIPKGAVLTNENLVNQSINMYNAFFIKNHGRGAKFLNIMPPWLAYGLSCAMSSILCMGMKMDIIPQFDYNKFDDLLIEHKPEVILGVPTFFEELIKSKKLDNVDLSFLKAIIVGGSPLFVGTEDRINKFLKNHNSDIKITKGWGMTEMCAVASYTSRDECNNIGSVGIPLVFNNIAVIDPETKKPLGYNEVGEFYLTGPTKMKCYLNNQEETDLINEEFNGENWIKTGDIGYVTENGEIFHKDRSKQMIIYEGHNIFPSVIENVISKHKDVSQVAVVGIVHDDSQNTEIPTAFITLYKNIDKTEEEIIEELKQLNLINLPQRDIARDYRILDSLPLNPTGKIDKVKLREEQTKIINAEKKRKVLSLKKIN